MEDWLLLGSAEYYKLKTLEASTCSFPLGTKVYYNSDCGRLPHASLGSFKSMHEKHACMLRKKEGRTR